MGENELQQQACRTIDSKFIFQRTDDGAAVGARKENEVVRVEVLVDPAYFCVHQFHLAYNSGARGLLRRLLPSEKLVNAEATQISSNNKYEHSYKNYESEELTVNAVM